MTETLSSFDAFSKALADSLGLSATPPTAQDLADWVEAHGPDPDTRMGALERFGKAGLLDGESGGVKVGVMRVWFRLAFHGIHEVDSEGQRTPLSAAHVLDVHAEIEGREDKPPHPLQPLVWAWLERPTEVEAVTGNQPRLLPYGLGLVTPKDESDTRTLALLSNVAQGGQLRMPDFPEVDDVDVGLALPVQLFDLGAGKKKVYGKGAAPLALRLFVESLLALKVEDRGRRAIFTVKLRDLLDRLYPNGRPSPAKYWPKLTEAAELISGNAARIPWYDYERRTGGLWQAVTVRNIPRHRDALDDYVTMEVYLPPTARRGPPTSPNLPAWGVKSARAYRLLLNLPAHWWVEGKTFKPKGKRAPWGMTPDADAYPVTTETALVRMAHPTSENQNSRDLWKRTRDTLEDLAAAGEILPIDERSDGLLILPPWVKPKDRA